MRPKRTYCPAVVPPSPISSCPKPLLPKIVGPYFQSFCSLLFWSQLVRFLGRAISCSLCFEVIPPHKGASLSRANRLPYSACSFTVTPLIEDFPFFFSLGVDFPFHESTEVFLPLNSNTPTFFLADLSTAAKGFRTTLLPFFFPLWITELETIQPTSLFYIAPVYP